MKAFLEEVTAYVLDNYADKTGSICLVTPNRRAGLFFRKYFSEQVTAPIWAPDILSIEDFINQISGLTIIDNISLLFQFYDVYCTIEGNKAQAVEEFLSWAPVLLNDVNEIDANLWEPEKLFDHLQDIKRIETWNPDGAPLTGFQRKYLDFFSSFKTYHKQLRNHLLGQQLGYQGLSSRIASQKLKDEGFHSAWEKIVFVGFNALNQSEEFIIHSLLKQGKADYLVDSDTWYVDDQDHEAGFFIRKYAKLFGLKRSFAGSYIATTPKRISILGMAKNVNQARLAGNILLQHPELPRNDQTAIVLANENLLIPLLNALPEDTGSVNVTMGYPLSKTNMYGFFEALWKLYLFGPGVETKSVLGEPSFYYKDIIRFFSHSCTGLLWGEDHGQELAGELVRRLKQSNRPFLTFTELQMLTVENDSMARSFGFLAENWHASLDVIFPTQLDLVARLDAAFRQKAGMQGKDIVNTPFFVDFEALYFFASLFRRLQDLLQAHPFLAHVSAIYGLFKQLAGESRLSFSGEPLKGLQVMGMLETRSLDFKHLIIISANENILPRPGRDQSFIPYDVKRQFGLLVHTDKDAIYAYHFYRLLQRAEHVYLIYNTQSEDIGTSEKSRFITQLLMELPDRAPMIRIEASVISLPPPPVRTLKAVVVEKTSDMMDRLKRLAEKGLSPSALNTYINCSLQFYFTRIACIEEPLDMEESAEATTMGTVVHAVLETLYKPFVDHYIDSGSIALWQKQVDELTHEKFAENYSGGDLSKGRNVLLLNLAKRYVHNYLKAEKRFIEQHPDKLRILALEQQLHALIDAQVNGTTHPVKIRGLADRIDCTPDHVRVIDYKTGKISNNELLVKDWALITRDSGYAKVFQLMTYAWLYKSMNPNTGPIQPGIISLREPSKGLQSVAYQGGDGFIKEEQLDLFASALKLLLSEMLNPDVPFSQTPDEANCTYCPFKVICNR
jgi:ATP-dependent helicase/nuclease subunit B